MIEQEVIEGKLNSAQQVLDHIESPDFSQKRFLRLDQDVTDSVQAAQFLQNYARVGLIKERLAEIIAGQKPTAIEPSAEETPTQKPSLVFLDNNQIELNGRVVKLSGKEYLLLSTLAKSIDEQVRSRDASFDAFNIQNPKRANLRDSVAGLKKKLNLEGEPELVTYSGQKGTASWVMLQGVNIVWLEEEVTPPKQPPVVPPSAGVESLALQSGSEVWVIPYEPSEDEQRSDEETKILQFVVEALSRNRNITFEELQKAISPESRIRTVAGKRQLMIYQGSELKEMFNTALTKFREEAAILNLRETWSDEELGLWSNLQLIIRNTSGNDITSFTRTVRTRIDSAERVFYSSLPEEERQRRIFWIDL